MTLVESLRLEASSSELFSHREGHELWNEGMSLISKKFTMAADEIERLRLQLSRAKEWMQHEPRCNIHDHHFGGMPSCTCGLAEFLKEVWV